jgi:ABC-type sugar transport system ATPase subunit
MSIIYITHKLSEIFQIASRVIVMRDGKYIGSRQVDQVTENDLVAMMVGRQITNLYSDSVDRSLGEKFFRVENFARRGRFEGINFELRRGEILGFAGLVGAGRTEVGRAIFGIDRRDTGRVLLYDVPLQIDRSQDAIQKGIAYLTEDRKGLGLFLGMTLRENVIAPSLRRFTTRLDFLNRPQVDRYAQQQISTYDIQTPSIHKKVLNLSGGNQQKCLVAMWMGIDPQVIIFDEPTRGVDVGARAEIYRKLREFAALGVGIILISSDLPELIGMCDRVLVLHKGRIVGEVQQADFSEEYILSYAAGIDDAPARAS